MNEDKNNTKLYSINENLEEFIKVDEILGGG